MALAVDLEVTNPRVSQEKGHILYEIVINVDRAFRYSVFHRYSEFASLNDSLQEQYGAQMSGIILPSKKLFGTKDPSFIRAREQGLNIYLRAVGAQITSVLAFAAPHLSSAALRDFLQWDRRAELNVLTVSVPISGNTAAGSSVSAEGGGEASAAHSPSGAPQRPTSQTIGAARRMQSRAAVATSGRSHAAAATSSASAYQVVARTGATGGVVGGPSLSLTMGAAAPAPAAGNKASVSISSAGGAASMPVPAPAPAPAPAKPMPGPPAPAPMPQAPMQAPARPPAPAPVPAPAPAPAARPPAPAPAARPPGGGPPRPAGGPPSAPPAARPAPPPAGTAPPPPDKARGALLDSIKGPRPTLKKVKTVEKSGLLPGKKK